MSTGLFVCKFVYCVTLPTFTAGPARSHVLPAHLLGPDCPAYGGQSGCRPGTACHLQSLVVFHCLCSQAQAAKQALFEQNYLRDLINSSSSSSKPSGSAPAPKPSLPPVKKTVPFKPANKVVQQANIRKAVNNVVSNDVFPLESFLFFVLEL